MNDPGLDDPIADASEKVKEIHGEGENSSSDQGEEEEEKEFLLPARWWFASTAFPLCAGTFGPMANAFNLCAVVENWRVSIPPGGTEEHGIDIKDPKWLIGINAVSVTFALIANISLLLNMARRIPFAIAQPITILGFWLSSVLLIALIAVASHHFRAPGVQDQALTQAYYYAIFAAVLYQIISYMMCITVWGAYQGHYSKEFKLTMSQRTLMLQTISFMAYLLVGALIFSKVEGWKFLDAVYWADFTCLTIGIGDYSPQTHLGRGLLFPFAIGGVVTLGLVIGSIRTLVLERGKVKMAARMTEKTRERVIKRINAANDKRSLRGKLKGIGLDDRTTHILKLDPNANQVSELRRRKAEFDAMRRVQELAHSEQKWYGLAVSFIAWMMLWIIGAAVFYRTERNQQWTYFESLYFAYTVLLTIGYGDFYPMSNSGKPFFVLWSLLAVPTLTILISNMGDTLVKGIRDVTIFFGEITVLPSEKGGVLDRLKYGLAKMTGGRVSMGLRIKLRSKEEDKEISEDFDDIEEQPPGLIHMAHRKEQRDQDDGEELDRIERNFEDAERQGEDEARKYGDRLAEYEHHLRRILVSEIRKVYADVSSANEKKYTYKEWMYYLRLLGEDEKNSKYHRKAPAKVNMPRGKKKQHGKWRKDGKGKDEAEDPFEEKADNNLDDGVVKWSWIGNRSPLMGGGGESEWILGKLFERLEENLQNTNKKKEEEGAEVKDDDQDEDDIIEGEEEESSVDGESGPSPGSSREKKKD